MAFNGCSRCLKRESDGIEGNKHEQNGMKIVILNYIKPYMEAYEYYIYKI